MADRQNKTVAIRPNRMFGVESQEPLPQTVGNGCQSHRRARMTRIGLLDGIHAKRANRVDRQLIELLFAASCGYWCCFAAGHWFDCGRHTTSLSLSACVDRSPMSSGPNDPTLQSVHVDG